MILHPAIIALCIDALLTCGILVYAAFFALRILRSWDLSSGSELQVALEQRTCLISTIMATCLVFQVLSLFFFIHTADSLCRLFPGAMCAAGTLNLNPFGYPLLGLKLFNAVFSGIWLIINHVDSHGYDYPLIRVKYRLLLVFAPLAVIEAVLIGLYFLSLHPHVITSCCGSLFSSASTAGTFSVLTFVPALPMLVIMYASIILTLVCGSRFLKSGRGAYLFAASTAATFLFCGAALVIAISVYAYALPAHHCPFCLLHREYGYVGYLYYGILLGGGVAGLGVGALQPFQRLESLAATVPAIQRVLALAALILYALFAAAVACQVLVSDLKLA